MDTKTSRFKQFEKFLSLILLIALAIFVIYLIAAGNGIIWLKVLTAIIAILLCGLCLYFLYSAKLMTHPKSLWLTVAAICLIVCTLFSLILNFPAPL